LPVKNSLDRCFFVPAENHAFLIHLGVRGGICGKLAEASLLARRRRADRRGRLESAAEAVLASAAEAGIVNA
jgi:hypothetical protein